MNPENQPNTAVDRPKTPYVGMRAFQRNEQTIFFGRARDATLLRDKVFSARLTVVYGPSGVGKSSILHTLLIPYLEEEAARVIYFDNWTGADPLMTLKAELVAEAEKLKIPDPGAGAPDLSDLVLLLKSADDRTLVLILDQFEEFFTHGNNPEMLRQELGALIRASDLDVRVLLSLREEHLAALEPFRMEILTLFQSTYRLESLRDEGVQQAIEGPAKLFGVDFQPGLVSELINDLRHKDNVTRWDPVTGMAVDLPMLQLICSELWKEMIRRGQKTITRTLYRNLGGQAGILKAYLRQVMPTSWRQKKLTAQLMRYLAPSDGHKVPYSPETLAELGELDCDRVERELKRLSDSEVRVLRDRSYEGKVFYELYHDRFISFIGPWRDKILQYCKILSRVVLPASLVFSVMIIVLLGFSINRRYEYIKYTNWEMKKLNNSVTDEQKQEIFKNVANYLLDKKKKEGKFDKVIHLGSEESFDKLKRLFIQYEDFLPPDCGIERKELESWRKTPKERLSTLKYSPTRKLDEELFWKSWNNLSEDLSKSSGIIAPIILNLKNVTIQDHKPVRLGSGRKGGERTVRLEGENVEAFDIEIPFFEDKAVIQTKGLSETGKKFQEKFQSDWTPMGDWLVVPCWSIPVWKCLDVDPIGGSNITAFLLAESLKKHPDRLLTAEAVDILLGVVAKNFPHTVSEARAVRQKKLITDLQEIVKQGSALTSLPLILDALANYPEGSSSEVAPKVIANLQSAQETIPSWWPGAHPPKPVETEAASLVSRKDVKWYYRKTLELQDLKPKIAIQLGEDLKRDQHKVTKQIEKTQNTLMHRFGIELPKNVVTYEKLSGAAEIPNTGYRIKFLSEVKENPRKDLSQQGALDLLGTELTAHLQDQRTRFITADTVAKALDNGGMRSALKPWLEKRYSLTDLKLLLQTVVNPAKEELVVKGEAITQSRTYQIPPENSIHEPAWLLASLVFWSQAGDGKSLPILAKNLRRTQAARLVYKPTTLDNQAVMKSIKASIKALNEGCIPAAEAAFAQALKTDKEAAVSSFLVSYPEAFRQSFLQTYTDPPPDLWELKPNLADRIELADLLDEKRFAGCGGSSSGRILRLVLLAYYPEDFQEERHKLVECILEGSGEPDKWPAKEATWFGAQLLCMSGPSKDDRSFRKKGLAFLQNGLGRLSEPEAKEQFSKTVDLILKICEKSPKTQWCWELLPSLWEIRQDPKKAVDIAKVLVNQKLADKLEDTLTWIDRAKSSSRTNFSSEKKAFLEQEVDYLRAQALIGLRQLGAKDGVIELEQALSRLKETPNRERQRWAYQELAELWYEKDRLEEATVLLQEAAQKWPGDANFYSKMLEVNLAKGDKEGAVRTSREALEIFDKDGGKVTQKTLNFLDIAAWGQLATETGDWEGLARKYLEAGGGDVLDMAILLAWRLARRDKVTAREVVHPLKDHQKWLIPLQGNERLWSEKLLKYALGEMNAEELLGDLKDERHFSKSKLGKGPMPREGMLCEAYFYMALLAGTKGNRDQMITDLKNTLETKCHPYIEYAIARYLLARQQEL